MNGPEPLAARLARERHRGLVIATVLTGFLITCPPAAPVLAQATGDDAATTTAAGTPSVAGAEATGPTEGAGGKAPTYYDLFKTHVPINTAILVLSVIAVFMFLYLLLSLTSRGFSPPRFVDNVTKLILNRQFDQAIHLCQNHNGVFISTIMQRIVENRDKDHAVLMEMIATEGRRRAEPIWNRVNLLSEISNIAPLLGLLGTVMGMIHTFYSLTTRDAGQKAAELAEGIGTAMGSTMYGLFVAIGAGVFYTILRSRATVVLAEAEQVCHTVADHTARAAVDPRLKKIDALADAARQKIAQAASRGGATPSAAGAGNPTPRPTQP